MKEGADGGQGDNQAEDAKRVHEPQSNGRKAGAQKEIQTELFDGFEIVTYAPDGNSFPVRNLHSRPKLTFPGGRYH